MALMLWVKNWAAEQEGQDLVEYALLLGLIALVVFVLIQGVGTTLEGLWETVSSMMTTAAGTTGGA